MIHSTLLSRSDRKFLSLSTVILLLGVLCEAQNIIRTNKNNFSSLQFLAKFVFFNHLHVYLMFMLLFFTYAGRDYVSETLKTKAYYKNPWLMTMIIFPLWFGSYLLFNQSPSYRYVYIALSAFGSWHNGRQIWGFYCDFFGQSEKNIFSYRLAKTSFHFSMILSILSIMFSTTNNIYSQQWLPTLLTGGLFFSTVFICISASYKNKMLLIYSSRILFLNFAPFYNIALFSMMALHGVEYVLFFKNTLHAQNYLRIHRGKITLFFTAMALAIVGELYIIGFSRQWMPVIETNNLFYAFVVCFAFTATTLHYYLETFLFRFADPLVKKTLARLFHPRESSQREQKEAA